MTGANAVNIRRAAAGDVPAVAAIYERIHDGEEQGRTATGWMRQVYPTAATAQAAVERGDLFVLEVDGHILAAAILNQTQVPEYADCPWRYPAPEDQVMVLHTLVVDPALQGRGYGRAFVDYYQRYALDHGCPYLRMDTNRKNRAARRMYASLGFSEAGVVACTFNGIPGVELVCLEKRLEP